MLKIVQKDSVNPDLSHGAVLRMRRGVDVS